MFNIEEIWSIINSYLIYFNDVVNLRYINHCTFNYKFFVYINKLYQTRFIDANIFTCKGISSINLNKIHFNVKDVEYLSIYENNEHITNRAIYPFNNLKVFICGYHPKLHDGAIMFLNKIDVLFSYAVSFSDYAIQNLTNIKVLKCIQDDLITDNGIKRLTSLTVLLCGKNITDRGIKNLTNLKILYIHKNTNITDEGISYLINLKELYCGDNKNITDEGLKNLTKLSYIDNGKNTNITKKYRKKIYR